MATGTTPYPRDGQLDYVVCERALSLKEMLEVAFARWHVEKWFGRAKQEAGFGAFEVRTYTSLIRHWLSSRMAMYFLAAETQRLRGEKSTDHAGAGGRCGEPPGHRAVEASTPLATPRCRVLQLLSGPQ